jgi:putative ABC transport system permease protein
MFRNCFKMAVRSLWRNKGISAINIFGLSVGIATCLLILMFVQNELSYDRFNEKADRIVRVVLHGEMQGGQIKESSIMAPVGQIIKASFPEVEEATRIKNFGMPRITCGSKTFKDDAMAFVDSNFFRVFTIPLIKGNAGTALMQPNTAVISRATAEKYFGNEDPIGKVITLKDNNAAVTITGLIDKVPANSHFHFDVFTSMSTFPEASDQTWMQGSYYTYLVLREHYDYKKLEAKLPQLIDKYLAPQFQQAMGISFSEYRSKGNDLTLALQPLTDIHLHSDLSRDMEPYGDIHYVYIFSAIAVFMLLIACINFMNLCTASASKRAREVGIRKVLGSARLQLIGQFLSESLLLTFLALILALGLVYWTLPLFNDLAGQNLSLHFGEHRWIIPGLIFFGLFTGILAGSYPAFFLSSFNPVEVFKARFTSGKKSIGLRSGLVVFQFFISISLIIGTTVVYKQLSYIRNKNLGYDKEQVIVVEDTYWLGDNQDAFRQELLNDPRIANVTSSAYLPAGPSYSNNFFAYPDEQSAQIIKTLRYDVDYNYIPTLGMQIAKGRNFSKEYGSDSTAVIINETAAKFFGWNGNAVGHTISHKENDGKKYTYRVVGIVKDFHFRSLHEIITPLVMILANDHNAMEVKVKTADIAGVLSAIKNNWDNLKPESPFSYSFLDERFNSMYRSEQNIGRILGIFAGLTIFVACLGLFGLATFTAEQRRKEISIRKVLGADITGIVSLLSKDFLKLVIIAFIISAPVAWLVMDKWLQDFVYRVNISWWVFALTAALAIIITLVTVSLQAFRAAIANPINSLRSE